MMITIFVVIAMMRARFTAPCIAVPWRPLSQQPEFLRVVDDVIVM